jgi:large subunit ribosomal protein L6
MSKVGKSPIDLPSGVRVVVEDGGIRVFGSKGTLRRKLPRGLALKIMDGKVVVVVEKGGSKAMHGTMRALIANMVQGVGEGWKKTLELVGAGYRAEVADDTLTLSVGFSHPVVIKAPEGISFQVEKTKVTVDGIDKEVVGRIAAEIRKVRPPEPYKGKGIRYLNEVIRRKPGKAAKAQGVGVGQ